VDADCTPVGDCIGTSCENGRMRQRHEIEAYWTDQASTFDDQPDHGLSDPVVRAAWIARLAEWIGDPPVRVADLGCGTGSLSVLLAEAGHEVVGIDLLPAMVEQARQKARRTGLSAEFTVGDASAPDLAAGAFDVVLARHVVWTLPNPVTALGRWARLLGPHGRLVLVEGRWFSPSYEPAGTSDLPWDGGVPADELIAALAPLFERTDRYPLSDDSALWGKPVTDERYAIVACRPLPARAT
jgi:SAM-dependent methyltransferase